MKRFLDIVTSLISLIILNSILIFFILLVWLSDFKNSGGINLLQKSRKLILNWHDCKFKLNSNVGLRINKEQDVTCYENHECNIVCRFCHIDLPQNHVPCKTCEGYFCKKCKHECKNKISPKLLQGDRIEHPDYLLENKEIKPDYKYYFEHQIERPVQQIFDLTDRKEEIQEFCKEITIGEEYVRKQKEKKIYNNTSMMKFLQ